MTRKQLLVLKKKKFVKLLVFKGELGERWFLIKLFQKKFLLLRRSG